LMCHKAACVAASCRSTWMILFNRYTHEGTADAQPRFHGTTGAIIRVRPRTAPV
jgi:ribosomal protein L21E